MKKNTSISFSDIESIPQLVKDFLSESIAGFENKNFSIKNIETQMKLKENSFSPEKRKMLSEVLKNQYSGFPLSDKQTDNLKFLENENTFTVTTGHQLNLFTGPVFFIYKILQTIKLADFLNEKFPRKKMVPVFWLASEDHDFEEINHFKTENHYYEIKPKSGGAVGKMQIEDDFFISGFEEEFRDSVFGTELILLMKKAYRKGNTFSEATKILVQELFADYGLLFVDGDDALLKNEMKTVFRDELLYQTLFETTKKTVEFLTEKYGKVQVNPREINLFYLSKTRKRIAFDGEKFIIVDKNISFTRNEILTELENYPEKFSPNALMRPVYQETVLPNLAYIGGNAEIMYWLELINYFEKINIPFPLLIPRNSLLFVSEKTLTKAEKLGLSVNDFFRNFAAVSKEVALKDNQILPLLEDEEIALKNSFDKIVEQSKLTDQSFGNLVKAEKTRQLKSFERMKKRLLRAEKIKQHENLERLENVFLKIHPAKNWQERVYNFSVFYADYGRKWFQVCYDAIDVEHPELAVFSVD